MRPKDLLKRTWDKAWTKQWVVENTPFAVPNTLVFSATWFELVKWLKDSGIPQTGSIIIKPQNLSLSRGVRLVQKIDGGFLDALGKFMDISALLKDIVSDVPGSADSYKWIVEEYVWPPPKELAALQYDGPFNPLLRIIMSEGDFHFGEVHIPTNASRGRGSLRGGARRLCFDYTGKLFQTRPPVKDEPVWSVNNYGTKIDVADLTLPLFPEILENIKNHVCKIMAPRSLFAFDGCYRQTADKVEFVCIEIEHQPNVKHLAKFKDLRCPQT
jgi:hypothetical protein